MGQIFNSIIDGELTAGVFFIIMLSSFVTGVITAIAFSFRSNISKGFMITLSLIPAVVALIIIMVNGNLGAGIAVAGAFGLVRFRSAPGSAKEIGAIFSATASGLILGMGFITYALMFTILISAVYIILSYTKFGERKGNSKILKITVPENLNYDEVFDDLLKASTESFELIHIKSVNMGSMFKLTYRINKKQMINDKELLDKIRCLNGNLEVMLSKDETLMSEL